jgi:hypothetical protein
MHVTGQPHVPGNLALGKQSPVSIQKEAEWLGVSLGVLKKTSRPSAGIQTPDRPARSLVIMPTELPPPPRPPASRHFISR